jgi:hypothetical protein
LIELNFMIRSASDQAFLLMLIYIALGACFVWAFSEIEEARRRAQRQRDLASEARRSMTSDH